MLTLEGTEEAGDLKVFSPPHWLCTAGQKIKALTEHSIIHGEIQNFEIN